MNFKLLLIMALVLILGLSSVADGRRIRPPRRRPPRRKPNCSRLGRRDCGFGGISQRMCENKGCCFRRRRDGPWCYYPS